MISITTFSQVFEDKDIAIMLQIGALCAREYENFWAGRVFLVRNAIPERTLDPTLCNFIIDVINCHNSKRSSVNAMF